MTRPPEASPPPQRPVLVFVISIFYFIGAPFGLLSLALIPLMLSGKIPVTDTQRDYFESLTWFDYGASILVALAKLTGAVLLFRLKRSALPVLVGLFVFGLLLLAYNILAKNWLAATGGITGGFLFGYAITIAILLYVWRLSKEGVLR